MADVPIKHGMFTWTDLAAPDPEGVKPFYAGLFGWTFKDVSMGPAGTYTLLHKDDREVGGLSSMPPEKAAQGAPPSWSSYIEVDDVDGLTSRVGELGGQVFMPPTDIGEEGRMSVIQDPTGAVACLWQSRERAETGVFNEPGMLTWNELVTRDVPGAMGFYSELLGWTYDAMETSGMLYQVIQNGDRPNGGILQMTDEWPPHVPAHWMVYFAVEDVAESVRKAEELGGTIHVAPMDIEVGTFAVVEDPQGAVFTVFKQKEVSGEE